MNTIYMWVRWECWVRTNKFMQISNDWQGTCTMSAWRWRWWWKSEDISNELQQNMKMITIDIEILFFWNLTFFGAKCSLLFEMKTSPFVVSNSVKWIFRLLLHSKVVIIPFMRLFVVLFALCTWVLVTQWNGSLGTIRWDKHEEEKKFAKAISCDELTTIRKPFCSSILHCHLVALRWTQNSGVEQCSYLAEMGAMERYKRKKT